MVTDITLTRTKPTPEDIGGNEPLERFPLQLDGVGSGHHAAQSKEHLQTGHFALRDTLGRKNFTIVKFSLNFDPNISNDTWSRKALTGGSARARSYISGEREARQEARHNQNWSCPVFLLLCIKLKFSPYCPGTLVGLNQYFLVADRSCL